jgi:hypothetical protein
MMFICLRGQRRALFCFLSNFIHIPHLRYEFCPKWSRGAAKLLIWTQMLGFEVSWCGARCLMLYIGKQRFIWYAWEFGMVEWCQGTSIWWPKNPWQEAANLSCVSKVAWRSVKQSLTAGHEFQTWRWCLCRSLLGTTDEMVHIQSQYPWFWQATWIYFVWAAIW